ncbi:MAG: restriction endonuclease subunit M [Ignavibacteriae bacterium HGW-Ignavibacteriae-1]|jgi:type I restriction-modification system DNA methylase subunit|nr:MAG: restriction endonuclease subunit M [Ignavibacteriae bacterium HGW-Ignavibacteriae-1]
MSLFQKSVEKKYLNELDSILIDKKFKEFQDYFGNPVIQENIRNSKEEQYQEGFLRELFVSILGYTLNPHPNFNLTTELKNIANSKKADGAILKGEDAIAVIELKGTDTTDLDKIETQAFGYKNHHPKCVYVVTSNFEKLRFYIQNAVDHIDFDLFRLSREQFSLMWLCLAKENLLNGLALKIKESSLLQEENITKKLYADYSKFREAIYNNLIKNNPETDKLLLFKKTQKLLDRFLFVFFAEDRLLLPPNSISEIVKQWKTLRDELDEYVPLYDRFKKYFGYMNTGYKGKKYDIYAYNGGLFATDEILDNISIDDEILHYHTLTLSQYDFETDVDVNILGHIFEHSLGEIENVQAEIKGEKIDNQKTKRKKDGIFYTPKYITKYIVENTIGKLCEEKRISLDIVDEEYAKERKNRKREAIKELDDKLTEYRNWLLTLTILDPACGSGAFLNQALDFLINEHRKIDELRAQLFGGGLVFSDITSDILENNIYGVDINEESVEIAKLSLWLRTAQKGRKLNSLSNNIKCGNSLIDDPEVAGDKAFNWQNEFPDIFANGGFDVVIGNPPYVDNRGFDKTDLDYLFKNYPNSFQKSGTDKYKTTKLNLIAPFIELNSKILRENGFTSFIFHKNIFKTNGYTSIRKYILQNFFIDTLTDWGAGQFQDVIAETATFTLMMEKKFNENIKIEFYNLDTKIDENNQSQEVFLNSYEYIFGIYASKMDRTILQKIEKSDLILGNLVNINNGIVTGNDKKYISKIRIDQTYKKAIRGRDISRYSVLKEEEYILYNKDKLLRARDENIFLKNEKLIMQMININFILTYDNTQFYNLGTTYAITLKNGGNLFNILGILNSKLVSYYYKKKYTNDSSLTNAISTQNLNTIPIPSHIKDDFHTFVLSMLNLNSHFSIISNNFLAYLKTKFNINKIGRKLESWYKLDFSVFIEEIHKIVKNSNGVKLSKSDEMEWMELFEAKKAEAQALQSEIEKTDKEIDLMVYQLYELTEDEIRIVEESN